MKKLVTKLGLALKRIRMVVAAFIPTPLPQNGLELESWLQSILEIAGLPNNDSFQQAVCTHLMHLGTTTAYKPKLFFILAIRKAVANQVAYERIDQIRQQSKKDSSEKAPSTENTPYTN